MKSPRNQDRHQWSEAGNVCRSTLRNILQCVTLDFCAFGNAASEVVIVKPA